MGKFVLLVSGWTTIGAGLMVLPLPAPFGVPMLLVGGSLVLMADPAARGYVRSWRGRHPQMSETMAKFEPMLPRRLRAVLRTTHPNRGARGHKGS